MNKFIALLVLLGVQFASAATITIVDAQKQLVINAEGNHELNLTRILKSNAEIASVKIRAKSDFGGAQVYLQINGNLTNGGIIDTDPSLYDSNSGFAELVLTNYERVPKQEAKLIITPAHNAKIQSVEVNLGQAEDLKVLQRYPNPLIVAGGAPQPQPNQPQTKPPVVTPPVQPNPQPRPPVVTPQPPQPQRPVVNRNCVPQRSGKLICVGDKVRNRLGHNGVVTDVHHTSPSQVTVLFEGRGSMTRDADYVLFFSR